MTARTPSVADWRTARRWLVVSLLALLGAWLLAPAAVPSYDGIGNPDQPYRYVKPPAGSTTTKAPTTAKVSLPVHGGVNQAGYANSGETGPQISLYLPSGALRPGNAATSVTVTAEPTAPTGPSPADGGPIVTNVYRISAVAGGKPAPVVGTGNQAPTLQMRAPSARQPGPVFEHLVNGNWTKVPTLRVGNDIYQAQLPVFGDWALVQQKAAAGSSSSGGGGVNVGLLAAGIGVLLLAGIIGAIRAVRTRQVAR